MEITFKMIEAIGNALHTPDMIVNIPPENMSIVASNRIGKFRENTPDECKYVDITFTDGKVLRFVTQNKNKRYEATNPKVLNGQAQAGQLKPYAIQAMGGAQITWVIANPYAPNNQQTFLGHVYNGAWKPKQANAYSNGNGGAANNQQTLANMGTSTQTQTQPDPGYTDYDAGADYVDPTAGVVDPNVGATPTPNNAAMEALLPILMKALQGINSNQPAKTEEQLIGPGANGNNLQI